MSPLMMQAMCDEFQKIAMPNPMAAAAGKMFGGARRAAEALGGQGLPAAMRSKVPTKVPRPHQLTGKLAPPSRAPRPTPKKLGPSAMAPPPPTARKAPIDWEAASSGLNFSGR